MSLGQEAMRSSFTARLYPSIQEFIDSHRQEAIRFDRKRA
jgi:hypothetical protein